ncbi:bifunctional folylpolyglutamate synthase/dihydrofolate synthase [Haloimpatiens sp. FM7330]|uniref:bifunctional folylpolyglutamate synthase/dihydrofolate synthase n=1 Tax=Haloimpatiens sp. FM7330 TaxID=3298610 RepID=UPI00362F3C02
MNYEEVMNYVNNTAKLGSNLGLERTEKLLELLGNPHKKLKCIHIAGTNGKGSTTSMISQIMRQAGYKVGMYTSPYIEEFEERIQINGENISKNDLVCVINKVAENVEKVVQLGYEHPTQFEIITCAMFLYFYKQKVDYAVIEVGLGGRLDSTNVINPILTIIASISFDHMHILGDTIDKIAYEKAGIIKAGVPVVLYPQSKEAESVIEKICNDKNSKLIKVDRNSVKYLEKENIYDETNDIKKVIQRLNVCTVKNTYDIKLSLLGKHQMLNCAVAIKAVEQLIDMGIKISKGNIIKALKSVKWPARLEIIKNNPLVVIDGAHNIDGITKLTESINSYFNYKKLILIIGILADKQVDNMVKTIVPMASKVITVTPNSDRAEIGDDLKNVVIKYNSDCESVQNYKEAYEKALDYCDKDDLLLICGSLYMVGDMRRIIRNK